jgi:hypothetical protein
MFEISVFGPLTLFLIPSTCRAQQRETYVDSQNDLQYFKVQIVYIGFHESNKNFKLFIVDFLKSFNYNSIKYLYLRIIKFFKLPVRFSTSS